MQTPSTVSIEKVSETLDKTSPTDFYGLFNDTKSANKDEDSKVGQSKLCLKNSDLL